jgi:hypothetical protein
MLYRQNWFCKTTTRIRNSTENQVAKFHRIFYTNLKNHDSSASLRLFKQKSLSQFKNSANNVSGPFFAIKMASAEHFFFQGLMR